jgi:hypothetical protein
MLPEVAFVEVKARVMFVLEPAVTEEGVAVRVAVGAEFEPLEGEPPQLASKRLDSAINATYQVRRLAGAAKSLKITSAVRQVPRHVPVVALREKPVCVKNTAKVQGYSDILTKWESS